jgi:hypothetical protein
MNAIQSLFKWTFKFALLYILFIVFFVVGSMAVRDAMPDSANTEPGLVSPTSGLLAALVWFVLRRVRQRRTI